MAALNVKIDPILPPDINFLSKMGQEIISALEIALDNDIGPKLQQKFRDRTEGWDHQPAFPRNLFKTSDTLVMEIVPENDNKKYWIWNTAGTKSHYITARGKNTGKPSLFIRGGIGGYNPHTKPGNSFGGPGTYDLSSSFWTSIVHHPGIEPRSHEEHIAEEIEPIAIDIIDRTVALVVGR